MALRVPAHRQRILITGASSGIGAEMARLWAGQGRDLALCARRLGELERVRDELLTAHPEITVSVHPLDVLDPAAVEAAVADAVTALGGLDRVVANAGVALGGSIGSGHAEDNRTTALTNVIGTLNQAEAAVRHFRSVGRGHFAVISSMFAVRGMAGPMNVYSASKAAVTSMAEGLRTDLHGTGIVVSSVHPGYIRTPLLDGLGSQLFTASLERGTAAIVQAIEGERPRAYVPTWPWAAVRVAMKLAPMPVFKRFAGG